MTISIRHRFVSGYADDADTTLVRASNWNDDHNITGAEDQANKNQLSGYAGVDANGFVTPNGYATDTGTANTYVITLSPVPVALAAGQRVRFKVANANTGPSTLNVNSLGAKSLVKSGSTALASGDLVVGQIVTAVYDGTNWQLQGVGGGGGSSTLAGDSDVSIASPSDGQILTYVAASSNWQNKTAGGYSPPLVGSYSWVNQGSAAASNANGPLDLTSSNGGGAWSANCLVRSIPSAPYRFAALLMVGGGPANLRGGLILRDSVSGKIVTFEIYVSSNFNWQPNSSNLNSPTSANGANGGPYANLGYIGDAGVWIAIYDDNTNRHFQLGIGDAKKVYWMDLLSQSRTNFITPDQIGYFGQADTSGKSYALRVLHESTSL